MKYNLRDRFQQSGQIVEDRLGNKILVSIKIVYISLKLNRFQCEQCGGEMFPEYYKGIHGQEYRLQDFQ